MIFRLLIFSFLVFWDNGFIRAEEEFGDNGFENPANSTTDATVQQTRNATITLGPDGILIHRFVGYGRGKTTTPERPPPDVATESPKLQPKSDVNNTYPCDVNVLNCSVVSPTTNEPPPTKAPESSTTKPEPRESTKDVNIISTRAPLVGNTEAKRDLTADENFIGKLLGIIFGIIVVTVLIVVGVAAILKHRKKIKERKATSPPPNPVLFEEDTKI